MIRAVVVAAVLAASAVPVPPATAEEPERLFRWQDDRITESSGLVDLGDVVVTTNDSGDEARLFVVDDEGRTVRTVDYGVPVRDVEALAPAGPRHVWVGDLGDNRRERTDLRVHRVEVVPGPGPLVTSYDVRYAGGVQADAEALVVLPSGRLAVVTKAVLGGGTVYRGPVALRQDRPNVLRAVGEVAEIATDAAYDPTSGLVLVRGYASVGAYEPEEWERWGSGPLPSQQQGEAISVGADGRVLVGSEGARSWVWRVPAPDTGTILRLEREAAPDTDPTAAQRDEAGTPGRAAAAARAAAAVVALLAAGAWLLRRRRRS